MKYLNMLFMIKLKLAIEKKKRPLHVQFLNCTFKLLIRFYLQMDLTDM